MALTTLQLAPIRGRRRAVELDDVRAAFARMAKRRWGRGAPLDALDIRRGALRIRTSSAPWRAAVLWAEEEIQEELTRELPSIDLRRLLVILS